MVALSRPVRLCSCRIKCPRSTDICDPFPQERVKGISLLSEIRAAGSTSTCTSKARHIDAGRSVADRVSRLISTRACRRKGRRFCRRGLAAGRPRWWRIRACRGEARPATLQARVSDAYSSEGVLGPGTAFRPQCDTAQGKTSDNNLCDRCAAQRSTSSASGAVA
jgi:hypothetical protein